MVLQVASLIALPMLIFLLFSKTTCLHLSSQYTYSTWRINTKIYLKYIHIIVHVSYIYIYIYIYIYMYIVLVILSKQNYKEVRSCWCGASTYNLSYLGGWDLEDGSWGDPISTNKLSLVTHFITLVIWAAIGRRFAYLKDN
jgi:hypothetical protein